MPLFRKRYDTGLRDDPRPPELRKKDYLHEERVFGSATDPFGNEQLKSSPFPYENQRDASSCVPHGVGLALGAERKLDGGEYARLSYTFVYRLRANYPTWGSWLEDIFNIYRTVGAPLYHTLPDPETEEQANAAVITAQMRLEADIFRGKEYYSLGTPNDMGAVANIAAQGHAVPVIFYSTYDEWAREYPVIKKKNLDPGSAEVRHCVSVLPKSGFTKNGDRYVTIQDSAQFGNRAIRHVREDFFQSRIYGAGYWDTVNFLGAAGKPPKYTFTKVLKLGDRNKDVEMLQKLLISERLLPTDCATGLFAGRTLAGLHAFQNKYAADILVPLGLDAPTDNFGSMSIAKANKLTK